MKIIDEIIKTAKTDETIHKFLYLEQVLLKWQQFLQQTSNSKLCYMEPDISDKDQCYNYLLPLGNQLIEFDFSIKYLRGFMNCCSNNKVSLAKMPLTNVRGELAYNNLKCHYNKCDTLLKHSSAYNDLDEVIIIPMPVGEYSFLVADGNHRICSQVNENKHIITTTYLDYPVVSKSLNSPLQIALYCFIEDIKKIRDNLGKITDSRINNILNINNPKGNLSIIAERN